MNQRRILDFMQIYEKVQNFYTHPAVIVGEIFIIQLIFWNYCT